MCWPQPCSPAKCTGLHVTASYKRSTTYDAQKEAEDVGNDLSNKVRKKAMELSASLSTAGLRFDMHPVSLLSSAALTRFP